MLDDLGPSADSKSELVRAESLANGVLMRVQESACNSSNDYEADSDWANMGV